MSTQIRASVGVSLAPDGDPVNHGRSPFNGNGSDPIPLAPTLVGSQVAFTTRSRLRRSLRVLCYRERTPKSSFRVRSEGRSKRRMNYKGPLASQRHIDESSELTCI